MYFCVITKRVPLLGCLKIGVKLVPDIITDKEKIAEEAPCTDTQTVLKELQKMQNTFFTV